MTKKEPEVTVTRYISEREQEIIRTLELTNPDLKDELETIHYFEKTRGILHRSVSAKLEKTLSVLRNFMCEDNFLKLENEANNALEKTLLAGWSSSYEKNRFKIYANSFPVRLYWKKVSPDIDYLNNELSRNIAKMLRKAMIVPINLDKVFVWIKFYMPLQHYDIDNSYYKPIIDGIVRSGLILNDDISNLSFGFKGYYSIENPHMEIFIYPENDINFCEILDKK